MVVGTDFLDDLRQQNELFLEQVENEAKSLMNIVFAAITEVFEIEF